MLDEKFFKQILVLENKLFQKNVTIEEISTLVDLYTQCIEQYDNFNDPIMVYFTDKIQTSLSLTSTMDKLFSSQLQMDQSSPLQRIRDTKAKYLSAVKEQGKEVHQKLDYEQMKLKKADEFKMQLEMKQNKSKLDINQMIKDFEDKSNSNNQILFDDLEEQVKNLKSQLENQQESKENEENNQNPVEQALGDNHALRSLVTQISRISNSSSNIFVNPINIQQEFERVSQINTNTRSRNLNQIVEQDIEDSRGKEFDPTQRVRAKW